MTATADLPAESGGARTHRPEAGAAARVEPDEQTARLIATALHEYADKLAAVPVDCTALTGPVWYGRGWDDAVHHLHDLADGLMPAPKRGGDVR